MIDLKHLEKYRENNRIEAKKALGGFPQSFWETYSAFANTLGGIILLGVEEHRDKSLHAVDLPSPEKLVNELWETVENPNKVSANVLSAQNVNIEEVDGKRIVIITVPRAERYDRPVFVGGNPFGGTYRRSGEGDYRCAAGEVESMLRDAARLSQDAIVLKKIGLEAFDLDCIHRYRGLTSGARSARAFKTLDDVEFLNRIGAVDRDENGSAHPTAAGLLMFGFNRDIVKEFPSYSLVYRDGSNDVRLEQIASDSGDWSGNVFDFYFRVSDKLNNFQPDESLAHGRSLMRFALREALANCLVNADYRGRQGVTIVKSKAQITFSNPGSFRLDVETAKSGGVSDPRNLGLTKMFNLISVGERAGRGISGIFSAWRLLGLPAPTIAERFEPERIIFTLPLETAPEKIENGSDTADGDADSGGGDTGASLKEIIRKAQIIRCLTDRASAKSSELQELLGISELQLTAALDEMIEAGLVTAADDESGRVYKLKR